MIRRGPTKREPKPFVVEVKRGARRSSFFGPLDRPEPMSEAVRRAELALFSGVVPEDDPPPAAAEEPSAKDAVFRDGSAAPKGGDGRRRILRSLVEPEPAPVVEEPEPPRRRGRKPGSKNKPKPVPVVEPARLETPAFRQDPPAAEVPAATPAAAAAAPADREEASFATLVSDVEENPSAAVAPARPDQDEAVLPGEADDTHPPDNGGVGTPERVRVRLRARSKILARYVLETEPVPGERWRKTRQKAERRRQRLRAQMPGEGRAASRPEDDLYED